MKVAFFLFYPPTLWTPGGGERQILETYQAVKQKGVEAFIFDILHPTKEFDILHVFGSSYQMHDFIITAKKLGMRVILTPIAYSVKPSWQWYLWKRLDPVLPVATIYRLRKEIYDAVDLILPASQTEAKQLHKYFDIPWTKFRIVPNGVHKHFAEASSKDFEREFGFRDFVLQVGRIGHHKGQLRLIQAMKGTNIPLVFIGPLDYHCPESQEFYSLSKRESQILWLGELNRDDPLLMSAYAAAKVHALPSVSESFGLVTLEAGLAGCNIVTTLNSPIKEYLGDKVLYCQPLSIDSIRKAVLRAYNIPRSEELRLYILENFTWDKIADKLIKIYQELLNET